METKPYKHAAIFANEVSARNVMERIRQAAIPGHEMVLLEPAKTSPEDLVKAEGNTLRHKAIRNAVYGTTGGAVSASLASLAATSLKIAAFAGHPLLAGLAAVGYGSLLGGAGGVIFSGFKGDAFLNALEEALKNGNWVLIVHSETREIDQKISRLLERSFTENIYESS